MVIHNMVLFYFILSMNLSAGAFTLSNSGVLGWVDRPLSVYYNSSNCGLSESEFVSLIDASVEVWNQAPWTGLKLEVAGTTEVTGDTLAAYLSGGSSPSLPQGIVVSCASNFSSLSGYSADSTAGVGLSASQGGGYIDYGFVVINAESSGLARISNLSDTYRKVVVAHEIGHALGIGHSGNQGALMYYSINGKTQLILSSDDIDAITYLYAAKELSGDSFMGCSSSVRGPSGPSSNSFFSFAALFFLMGLLFHRKRIFSLQKLF